MKKFLFLLMIVLVISTSVIHANIFDPGIDKLKRSTAIVYTLFADANYEIIGYKTGTGFFVGNPNDCILVTAFHVVSDYDAPYDAEYFEIVISYGYEPSERVYTDNLKNLTGIYPVNKSKKYWEVDTDYDIIVFNLKGVISPKPSDAMDLVKTKSGIPGVGSYVATMGHTEGIVFFNYGEGKVTAIQNPFIYTNFTNVSFGNSGGCVMNSSYECIGFIDAKMAEGVMVQLSVSSTYIYPLVQKVKSSTKGEDKTLTFYIPPEEYKDQVITGNPNINYKLNK